MAAPPRRSTVYLDQAQNTVTLIDERTLKVRHERTIAAQRGLEMVVDFRRQRRMRPNVFKHLCGTFTEGVPDIVVERANLHTVVIDQLGKVLTVLGDVLFVRCCVLFVTRRFKNGLFIVGQAFVPRFTG